MRPVPRAIFILACLTSACGDEADPFAPPTAGPQLRGSATAYGWAGYSIAAAGDVDGDGAPDLLVSSHSSGAGGSVALLHGPVTGEFGVANLDDHLVHAGGCDVNGDGHADILLGSPFADRDDVAQIPSRSGDNVGKAYLFLGGPDLLGPRPAAGAHVRFLGEDPYDTAGSAVACLGDLDGDGHDDLAIAAKGNARGGPDAGAVYIVHGADELPATLELADADTIVIGDEAHAQAGVVVAAVGDVTGDDRPDLLIGAPNSDRGGEDSGLVLLLPGAAGRLPAQVDLADAVHLFADEPNARLGWSLDRAGDLDGDGVGDLVLGSSPAPADPTLAGVVWVVRGGDDLRGDVRLAGRATRISGEAAGDELGVGVAGGADLTGDDRPDLVLGATGRGRVYLVPGRRAWPAALSLASAPWTADTRTPGDHYGETIAVLPDIDGDERPDLAVTAKNRALDVVGVGAVDLYLGPRPGDAAP